MSDRLDLARELVDRILRAHAIGLGAEEIASLMARGMEIADEAAVEGAARGVR